MTCDESGFGFVQERLSKSCADEEYSRLRETQHINKSLSALGDVIAALKHKAAHIPSVLTRVVPYPA
jgi:hypothetical protein